MARCCSPCCRWSARSASGRTLDQLSELAALVLNLSIAEWWREIDNACWQQAQEPRTLVSGPACRDDRHLAMLLVGDQPVHHTAPGASRAQRPSRIPGDLWTLAWLQFGCLDTLKFAGGRFPREDVFIAMDAPNATRRGIMWPCCRMPGRTSPWRVLLQGPPAVCPAGGGAPGWASPYGGPAWSIPGRPGSSSPVQVLGLKSPCAHFYLVFARPGQILDVPAQLKDALRGRLLILVLRVGLVRCRKASLRLALFVAKERLATIFSPQNASMFAVV